MPVIYFDRNDRTIVIPRPVPPPGVQKPYEYVLPAAEAAAFGEEANAFAKKIGSWRIVDKPTDRPGIWGRCDRKYIAKGVRVELYFLAGTQKAFKDTCNELQEILNKHLGPEADLWVEKYDRQQGASIRFTTWIKYAEIP